MKAHTQRKAEREQRKTDLKTLQGKVESIDGAHDTRFRWGGAMEYDPRQGESMVPNCVEFKVEDETDTEFMKELNAAMESVGDFKIRRPTFKQPGFTWDGREYYTDADYDAFVRIVHDRS